MSPSTGAQPHPVYKNESSETTSLRITADMRIFTNHRGSKFHPPPGGPSFENFAQENFGGETKSGSKTAFTPLWVILEHMPPPPEATIYQVADALIHFSNFKGTKPVMHTVVCWFGGLIFPTLLTPYGRLWSQNPENYGAFWDPKSY